MYTNSVFSDSISTYQYIIDGLILTQNYLSLIFEVLGLKLECLTSEFCEEIVVYYMSCTIFETDNTPYFFRHV